MNKENLKEVAKHIARYATCKPKLAMDRLMRIELIRNSFSKGTLYNLIIGARRIKKDGKVTKGISKEMAAELITIFNLKPDNKEAIALPEPKISLKDKLTAMEENFKKQKEIYENKIEELTTSKLKIDKEIELYTSLRTNFINFYTFKTQEVAKEEFNKILNQ